MLMKEMRQIDKRKTICEPLVYNVCFFLFIVYNKRTNNKPLSLHIRKGTITLVKKLLGVLLLLALISYTAWQNFAPAKTEAAPPQDDLRSYEDGSEKNQDVPASGLEEGKMAPDFTLSTLDGKTVSLSSLRGKKVIVNFWATYCPPCKEEMPQMQTFHEKYGKDVKVLAVNLTSQEINRNSVQKFVDKYHYTFPILLDEKEEIGIKKYKVLLIPTSYFIDEQGKIQQRIEGPMTLKQMEAFAAQ